MTAAVAFLCKDGVVIGADSMLSANFGNLPLAQHVGKKVYTLPGDQVFAYAGDQGLGNRFRTVVEYSNHEIATASHPLEYGTTLTQRIISQFASTGTPNSNGQYELEGLVGFPHGDRAHCCVFISGVQPRLLDENHFYTAIGSGSVSAHPFLRFLYEVFCQREQPTLREALFLVAWTLQYVIETIPGGVGEPIRIATLQQIAGGQMATAELSENDIREHLNAIQDARQALRDWLESLHAPEAPEDVPRLPSPP